MDTLYAYGVTELYSLLAATAAERLGLAPRFVHLDTTSFHVDGRYNSDEDPRNRSCTSPEGIAGIIGLTSIRSCWS